MQKPVRLRSDKHLNHVRQQPCCACGRLAPSEAHHLTIGQPKAMALKASDSLTVPLCRKHHEMLHRMGDERRFWDEVAQRDPFGIAERLWRGESVQFLIDPPDFLCG